MNRRDYLSLLSLSLLGLTILSGCSGSSGHQSAGRNLAATERNRLFGADSLQGSWESDCAALFDVSSYRDRMEFSGDSVTETLSYFSDNHCGKPTGDFAYSGRYLLGSVQGQPDGGISIDYDVTRAVVTVHDPAYIDTFNQDTPNGCRISGILPHVPLDLSSQDACLHEMGIGQMRYSVIRVRDGKLYLGDAFRQSGKTPQDRITRIEAAPLRFHGCSVAAGEDEGGGSATRPPDGLRDPLQVAARFGEVPVPAIVVQDDGSKVMVLSANVNRAVFSTDVKDILNLGKSSARSVVSPPSGGCVLTDFSFDSVGGANQLLQLGARDAAGRSDCQDFLNAIRVGGLEMRFNDVPFLNGRRTIRSVLVKIFPP